MIEINPFIIVMILFGIIFMNISIKYKWSHNIWAFFNRKISPKYNAAIWVFFAAVMLTIFYLVIGIPRVIDKIISGAIMGFFFAFIPNVGKSDKPHDKQHKSNNSEDTSSE